MLAPEVGGGVTMATFEHLAGEEVDSLSSDAKHGAEGLLTDPNRLVVHPDKIL